MGYTVNSIIINKEIDVLFKTINQIENWPQLHGYESVVLKERETLCDNNERVIFEISADDNGEKECWVSQRIINYKNYTARGVRLSPMYPFKYWILDIALKSEEEGTRMTWIQDFSMDPKTGHTDLEIEGYINEGSKKELELFKTLIEKGVVA